FRRQHAEVFVGSRTSRSAMGVVRILQEGRHPFEMIDTQSDWTGYRVLIAPHVITVDPSLKVKLAQRLASGGSLSAAYESDLDPGKEQFAISGLGVAKRGEGARNAKISVRVDQPVNRIRMVLQDKPVEFVTTVGRATFTLERLDGHQMIELSTSRVTRSRDAT
ncbi:MAG: hypothetical protein AAF961_10825, partial [Planctomycetota bacterium]